MTVTRPLLLDWDPTTPSPQTFPASQAEALAITGRTFTAGYRFDQASGAPTTFGAIPLAAAGSQLFQRTMPAWDGSSMTGIKGMEFVGGATTNYLVAAGSTSDLDASQSLTFVACLRMLRVSASRVLLGKQATSTSAGYRVTVAASSYPFSLVAHNGTTQGEAVSPGAAANEIDGGLNGSLQWWAFKLNLTALTVQVLGFRTAGTAVAIPAGTYTNATNWHLGGLPFAFDPETMQVAWLGVLTGSEAEAFDVTALNALDTVGQAPALYESYTRGCVTTPEVAYEAGFGLWLASYHGSTVTTGLCQYPHIRSPGTTAPSGMVPYQFRGASISGGNKRNNFTRTDDLANAAWTKTTMTAVADAADDPLGFRAAAQLTATAANAKVTQTVAITANKAYVQSVYVRRAGGSDVAIKLRHVDLAGPTTIVEQSFTATSEWTRVHLLGQHFTATSVRYELEIVTNGATIYATFGQHEYGWLTAYQPQRATPIDRQHAVFRVDNVGNRYYDPAGGLIEITAYQLHDNMIEDAYVFSTDVSDLVTGNKDRLILQTSDFSGSTGLESEPYDLDVQHYSTASALWSRLNVPDVNRSAMVAYRYAWDATTPPEDTGGWTAVEQNSGGWDRIGPVVPTAPLSYAASMPYIYPGSRYTHDAAIEGGIARLRIYGPAVVVAAIATTTPAALASISRVDRVASAAARLPGYMRKTRWLELLAAISAEVQEVEDMWLTMLASNAIDDAVGDQLDQIGALVAQPRGGAEDVDYRRRIRAKVAVNRSLGLVNDIIRIVRLVVNDAGVAVEIDQQGIAAYVAKLSGVGVPTATATDLAAFLRKGTSAGVRSIVESTTVTDDDAFTLDGPAGLGFVTVPTLPLGGLSLPSGWRTVIGIRPEWLGATGAAVAPITFKAAAGGGLVLNEAAYPDIDVTFVSGSTTIAQVEALLATSVYLFVVTFSTVSGTLGAGDAFTPTSVSTVAGAAGGVLVTAQE